MTFEAQDTIMRILFDAEERLLGKQAFYILSGILTDYFIEWGWWDAD